MHKNKEIHPALIKQLKKGNFNKDECPSDLEAWRNFLNKISRFYYDSEQERYLLERSMEISSREMHELYDKLEIAQNLAKIGYWYYHRDENRIIWSAKIYEIFGLDSQTEVPEYNVIMQSIHEEDRKKLDILINEAFAEGKDYEMEFRIKKFNNDETRWLYVKGTPNLNKIDLHQKIKSLTGFVMDITDRKAAEYEMKAMNQKLFATARYAGMSEVATSILHNVGNVMNSVNINLSLIKENLEKINLEKLIIVSQMIKDNAHNNRYFVDDHKGKIIPDYISSSSKNLLNIFNVISEEVKSLDVNLSHIKDIVIMQKDLSGVSGIKEFLTIPEIIETAINICFVDASHGDIKINKIYETNESFLVDKTKLLQVVVNLLRNAKDALNLSKILNKKIDIIIKKTDQHQVRITIKDNGMGIDPENLIRIFSFGYTTKKSGHGFGLHSSAIAIHEMDGEINVKSDGLGKGAEFNIFIPISPKDAEK